MRKSIQSAWLLLPSLCLALVLPAHAQTPGEPTVQQQHQQQHQQQQPRQQQQPQKTHNHQAANPKPADNPGKAQTANNRKGNISSSRAASVAAQHIGKGQAGNPVLKKRNGKSVYEVRVRDPKGTQHRVTVDAASGRVLSSARVR